MMKKVLQLALVCFLAVFVSCSDEEETLGIDVDVATQELATDLSEYEGTSYGSFKGVFSTNDSSDRGAVAIEVFNEEFAQATLTLVQKGVSNEDGEEPQTDDIPEKDESLAVGERTIIFQGVPTRTADGDLTIQFSGNNAAFEFVVAQDGTNPRINNASLNDNPSVIKTVKENTRGAVLTNPGLWSGTSANGTAISDTFSLIFVSQADADGDSVNITTMIMFDGNDIGSTMGNEQSNCDGSMNQTCDIMGVANLTPSIAINWTGTHAALGAPGTEDCSQFNGTWSGPGGSMGTFISDQQCTPPANDECTGAEVIACGDTLTASTAAATTTGEPTEFCVTANPNGAGVWYTYVGTADGNNVTVDLSGSTYDTKLWLYSGDCMNLVCLDGDDDGGDGVDSLITFLEEDGVTYYLYAAGFNGASGTLALSVTCAPPPPPQPGDEVATAIPFTPLAEGTGCGTETQFNVGGGLYTDSGMDSSCQGASNGGIDIFYTWTADAEQLLFTGGAGNPGVVVRDAVTGDEIVGSCLATFGNGPIFGWTLGQELVIQVYDFSGADVTVGFCLEERTPPPPQPGDEIATAIPFTPLAEGTGCGTETQFNIGGGLYSDSGMDSSCTGTFTGLDIFYTWTADAEELLFTGGAGSPGVVVRDAATGDEIVGACINTLGNGTISGWALGQDLIIQVYDFDGADVTVGFCLEASTPPPPLQCGDDYIDDGGVAGNYTNGQTTEDTITAMAGQTITVDFTVFQVENTWDHLRVFDGPDTNAPEITMSVGGAATTFTSATRQGFTSTSLQGDAVVSTGNTITLVFDSDGSTNDIGYEATITCAAGFTDTGAQTTKASTFNTENRIDLETLNNQKLGLN